MVKTYNSIIKEKGLTEISYQKDFLTNGKFLTSQKPFVLAMGTSAGKTLTTIMMLEMFYRIKGNSNKKTIIIPSTTIILRENFKKSLDKFKPFFSYSVIKNKKDLIKATNDSKCNVIVSLPQTLNNNKNLLSKVDIFILDEAHQWYFNKTITEIINEVEPKKQLLLSGTPSKFIQFGDKYNFQFVPIDDLYKEGVITNAKIEIISSTYSVKNEEYQSSYGDLKKEKEFSKKEDKIALEYVCNEMIKKITNKKLNNLDKFEVFKRLNKTIIFCNSIEQSDNFYSILKQNSDLKNKVLISHQISDESSENFIRFNNDKSIKILICVNRGRLGFNMNHLFNVVDFTLTKNIDTMLQIYGRLLRKSKFDADKIYFKIIPKNTEYYFINIMTAMLSLTQLEWYCKFNGKNMGGIRIPKIRNSYDKNTNIKTIKNSNNVLEFDLEKFGLPIDLNLFNSINTENQNSKFKSVAFTTLEEVRKKFNSNNISNWTYDNLLKEVKKFKTKTELMRKSYSAFIFAKNNNYIDTLYPNSKSKKRLDLNESKVYEIAKKYKIKADFRKKDKNAYWWAANHNILDDVCATMVQRKKRIIQQWTIKDLKIVIKKYNTKSSLIKNNYSAYNFMKQNNLFEKLL
jgi:superfamily II DNA or RNA helicase